MLLYNPGKWNCLILYLENGNDLFYHFIIVLPGLAIVYIFPNMTISFDRNYDIMTGIRKSFSQNGGAINFGACMLFYSGHLVIGQPVSKLHIGQSRGFCEVK